MDTEDSQTGNDPMTESGSELPTGIVRVQALIAEELMRQQSAKEDKSGSRPNEETTARDWLSEPVDPLSKEMVLDPALKPVPMREIGYESISTEEMLKGLIAECHFLMRNVALPTICVSRDAMIRRDFLGSAMELARTGAFVAETIGHLQHGSVREIRQRHEVVRGTAPTPEGQEARR
jgi:hypothetical protein